ncbi:MAG: hypothetical protein OHK0019_34580 [Saprospiraceae bacterium]
MENLDDFMRQKFDTDDPAQRFQFREEYWEQAQALIEAEEARRKKRRRWLLWWLFFGAIGVAVAVYGGRNMGNSSDRNTGGQQEQLTGNDGDAKTGRIESARSTDGRGIQTQGDSVGNSTISGEKIPGGSSSFLKNNPDNTANTSEAANQSRQKNTDNQNFGINKKGAGEVYAPGQRTKKSQGNPANPSPTPPKPTPEPGSPGQTPQAENTRPGIPADSANAVVASPETFKKLDNFAELATLLNLLERPERPLKTPFTTTEVLPIKPVREQKFSFGLAAAGTLSQASPDEKRLSGVGGVFAHYRFAPSWSLAVGANWRYLSGNWADDTASTESGQLRYSFGYKQDLWRLQTHGLHFLEIPLGLRWGRGALIAEAGFAPGLLIGVQGQITHEYSESLQQGVRIERSKVWLEKTPYRQFSPTFYLGGEWQAMRHLGLTLRGTYRPGSIGKKLTDAPVPANIFWLDAGLRWYF